MVVISTVAAALAAGVLSAPHAAAAVVPAVALLAVAASLAVAAVAVVAVADLLDAAAVGGFDMTGVAWAATWAPAVVAVSAAHNVESQLHQQMSSLR
jgi:hypothetical protein